MKASITRLILSLTVGTLTVSTNAAKTVKVFLLAGQSNMEGQGVVDLDHPRYYNGGKGILERVMADPAKAKYYAHLKDKDGQWVVRDDAFIRFRNKQGVMAGGVSIGFTGYGSDKSRHHIGPELQIGHRLGDHFKEPVLLIKTAWGGKSLFKDFRPPSAGGEVGPYYKEMLSEVKEALANFEKEVPSLKGRKPEWAGFIWFQGWNDMFNKEALAEYEKNLVHLIKDLRKELKNPKLPVVVGELGNGGLKAGANMLAIRAAQKAAAESKGFEGAVKFVSTTAFARPKEDSPNVGHGHHWFGNAESYFLIGDALGKGMVELLD
ncbi:MAG: sialate O-acetylesterase [Opitutales bacterium]